MTYDRRTEYLVVDPIPFKGSKGKDYTLRPGTAIWYLGMGDEGLPRWSASGWYEAVHVDVPLDRVIDIRAFLARAAAYLGGTLMAPKEGAYKIFTMLLPGDVDARVSFGKTGPQLEVLGAPDGDYDMAIPLRLFKGSPAALAGFVLR